MRDFNNKVAVITHACGGVGEGHIVDLSSMSAFVGLLKRWLPVGTQKLLRKLA